MKYLFCKLIPPHATFAQDMTPAERALMGQHVAYWQDLMHRQKALAFGPGADPQCGYGIGIIAASTDAEMETVRNDDSTIKANEGFQFEALPMPRPMSPLITEWRRRCLRIAPVGRFAPAGEMLNVAVRPMAVGCD